MTLAERRAQVLVDAREAVELDGLHFTVYLPAPERSECLQLSAALRLSPTLEVYEALLAGVDVPSHRLDPAWVEALRLPQTVTLDPRLALRVSAFGPLPASVSARRAA